MNEEAYKNIDKNASDEVGQEIKRCRQGGCVLDFLEAVVLVSHWVDKSEVFVNVVMYGKGLLTRGSKKVRLSS